MYSNHTFLYVLCNPPTNSEKYVLKSYVPIRSEQPSRSSRLICYVPTRSGYVPTRSTNEFGKKVAFFLRSYTFRATVSQKLIRGEKLGGAVQQYRKKMQGG